MPIILIYIDVYIEYNLSFKWHNLINIPIKYNYSKTIFIQATLTMYIIVSASIAK